MPIKYEYKRIFKYTSPRPATQYLFPGHSGILTEIIGYDEYFYYTACSPNVIFHDENSRGSVETTKFTKKHPSVTGILPFDDDRVENISMKKSTDSTGDVYTKIKHFPIIPGDHRIAS